jgi:hypothetical protein
MEGIEVRIDAIRGQLDRNEYTIAAKENAAIIELAFRELYRRSVGLLSGRARQRVFAVEQEIGGGRKTFEDFTMGQLVHVYRASDFLDAWSKATGNQLRGIQMINLDELVRLRNELTHNDKEANHAEAELLFHCVQSILETFGILSLEINADGKGLPSIVSDQAKVVPASPSPAPSSLRHDHRSDYSPAMRGEMPRLAIQGQRTSAFDCQLFEIAREGRGDSGIGLTGLDIGCADGVVLTDRFDPQHFSSVIGIDNNKEMVGEGESNARRGSLSIRVHRRRGNRCRGIYPRLNAST